MLNKNKIFLYEYLKLCKKYFDSKDKKLLSEINDIAKRDLETQNFIFNTFKETRCYCGRIDLESAEDISSLEKGDTFNFSKLVDSPVRIWCKDKYKLKKFMESKLFSRHGNKGIIITSLIKPKNILFDYDSYNNNVSSGKLYEVFDGTLKEYAKSDFKTLKVENTIKEVIVNNEVKSAEVNEVIKVLEDINNKKIAEEIKQSLGF